MKKQLLTILLILPTLWLVGQNPSDSLWHLAPFNKGKNSGIDLEKALEFVKDKKANEVIVAIADAGVDIYHPDLKNMLWVNTDEIADNGQDDDNNGFIDDVYGWNFLGDITYDHLELTRKYMTLNDKYELKPGDETNPEYAEYLKLKEVYLKDFNEANGLFNAFTMFKSGMNELETALGSDMTKDELKAYQPVNKAQKTSKMVILLSSMKGEFNFKQVQSELMDGYDHYDYLANYGLNPKFNPAQNPAGNNDVYYGEKFSSHGTHVAGIVAADGSNSFGAKGICQSCKIMSIRNVPDGDERDDLVANGIRYAVDNGAKIVNMSFGKGYAANTAIVYDAIRYAQSKGVLLIHAAGNDGKNNDETDNFPNDNNDEFNNWIEVGASSWESKPNALANFSNYGQTQIDLFAPGVDVYSTTPENQYEAFDGTSMASPVVSGVAAFVWSYYPSLTASEVKQILMESAIPIKGRNRRPGKRKKTRASKISKSGAEVNLYEALKLAEVKTTSKP